MGLPNRVTFIRLFLSILIVPAFYIPGKPGAFTAALIFLLASLSDFLDGYIARMNNGSTELGELLDPIADKTLVCVSLVMLAKLNRAPGWAASLIVFREIVVAGVRMAALKKNITIEVSFLGKVKTSLQMASLFLLILHYPIFSLNPHKLGTVLLYVALAATLLSGYGYVKVFRDVL